MDLSGFADSIISFAQNNTIIAILVGLILLYFVYRKPKLFLILILLGLFLYGLVYMVTSMGSSGSAQKRKLLQQEEKQPD